MTVFGVHFPSQGNPRSFREKALKVLDEVTKSKRETENVIVGGDFNISAEEDLQTGFYTTMLAKQWGAVSHLVGCKTCKGTEVYRGKWSFLDAILFSKSLVGGGKSDWNLDNNSIRIVNNSVYQSGRYDGSPHFDPDRATGVSDHYPLGAELNLKTTVLEKKK